MTVKVLFVDDDVNVLNGIRRMLRGMRKEWEMSFASGGAEALELMRNSPVDVVVSDMRMPGMDGATLLNAVRHSFPHAVRIILSGYAEEEAVLRTVGPAHQYLAKPCDAEVLVETIKRALSMRRYLGRKELVELVSGLDHVPALPATYTRLLQLLDDPNAKSDGIADTIAEDLAMTVQTLKLTNSAYFALPQKVENLKRAVALLGLETIKALVLVAGFFKRFNGDADSCARIERLSERCLSIGMASRAIAEHEGLPGDLIDQASSAGVLTHIGTLVLITNWPRRYREAEHLIETRDKNVYEAEKAVFGAAHPEIGAYLLGLWGFSDPITEAVAFHHIPWSSLPSRGPSVLPCVYAAQQLLKSVDVSGSDDIADLGLDMKYLSRIKAVDRLPRWAELARNVKARSGS